MKKLCLLALFVALAASSVWARQDTGSLKDLAVSQMFEYGQMLYDRKDYNQAIQVFQRVYQYDPQNTQVIAYLQKLGIVPVNVNRPKALKSTIIAVAPSQPTLVVSWSGPNADLKQEIAQEHASIDELIKEVAALRLQAEAQFNE